MIALKRAQGPTCRHSSPQASICRGPPTLFAVGRCLPTVYLALCRRSSCRPTAYRYLCRRPDKKPAAKSVAASKVRFSGSDGTWSDTPVVTKLDIRYFENIAESRNGETMFVNITRRSLNVREPSSGALSRVLNQHNRCMATKPSRSPRMSLRSRIATDRPYMPTS